MVARRSKEASFLLALNAWDLANLVYDRCDELYDSSDVCILWQGGEDLAEIDARVLTHHLHKHLEENNPAKPAGFVGEMGRSIRVEQFECIDDTLEEQSQPSTGGSPIVGREVVVL